ncbi:hypothetical protein J6590_057348 [Homalodisca vitripennis]|nr:hypothetical protein J6590_057348 [Homalodisca vitripennis]
MNEEWGAGPRCKLVTWYTLTYAAHTALGCIPSVSNCDKSLHQKEVSIFLDHLFVFAKILQPY